MGQRGGTAAVLLFLAGGGGGQRWVQLRVAEAVQLHIEVSHSVCGDNFSAVAGTSVSLNYTTAGDAGPGTGHALPDCGAFLWSYSASDVNGTDWSAPWQAAALICNEDGSSSISFFANPAECGQSNAVDVDGELTRALMVEMQATPDGLPGANVSLGGTVLVTTRFPLPATHLPGGALASTEGVRPPPLPPSISQLTGMDDGLCLTYRHRPSKCRHWNDCPPPPLLRVAGLRRLVNPLLAQVCFDAMRPSLLRPELRGGELGTVPLEDAFAAAYNLQQGKALTRPAVAMVGCCSRGAAFTDHCPLPPVLTKHSRGCSQTNSLCDVAAAERASDIRGVARRLC